MKWYTVEENFLNWLRSYECRIPNTDYGQDKLKPFFGALFETDTLVYISQVSHAKQRHNNIKENMDFIKLYDDKKLLAVVNLNYMFPVLKSKLVEIKYNNIKNLRTFKNEKECSNYIVLLKKEMKELNKKDIGEKAKKLYDLKNNYPDNDISKRCFDFKGMERKCQNYVQEKE
ncbi:protein AbiQ [Hathewaya proteolytica DSM 3090]|uniref:Protein AbiQ n=1 Tax=Hathewaya proteolytica DSM 3090 TaxID=1121331 RepID=A0A1M6MX71_9CLOT|nr:type III toxin-antitoxin system ToxN/AbiQ family toxin [Hathewaya proteolytica]SHJ88036.1 protein AbiQ [Hathewaya proteolytica DSM 3090]